MPTIYIITGLLCALISSVSYARNFQESRTLCTKTLELSLLPGPNDGDPPTLQVQTLCTTLDQDGTPLRQLSRNLASTLTAAQILQLTRLLQRIDHLGANTLGIPTPRATPTDIPVRTPRPEGT